MRPAMNPIRNSPSFIPPAHSTATQAPSSGTALHSAVASRDSKAVARLRNEGARANKLDAQGHSPLDVLDTMRDIDERSRSSLRMALLQSLNPTAHWAIPSPRLCTERPGGWKSCNRERSGAVSMMQRVEPSLLKARCFSLIERGKVRALKPLVQTCAASPESMRKVRGCIPATRTRALSNTAWHK